MKALVFSLQSPVLELPFSPQLQQRADSKIIAASFYSTGENIVIGKKEISVSEPCALLIEQDEEGITFSVTDARMEETVKQIVINYGRQKVVVDMPQKEKTGATVVCRKTMELL